MRPRLPDLTDGVVRLRRWRYEDLGCVRAASEDPVIPEGTSVPPVWSQAAGREWVARQRGHEESGRGWSRAVVRAADGAAVGCVVLLDRRQPGVAGLGFWTLAAQRGHGVAPRAAGLVTRWALTLGGMERVEAWVEPGNAAALAVLRRCGFVEEGRLRSFLVLPTRRSDALVLSKVRADLAPVR